MQHLTPIGLLHRYNIGVRAAGMFLAAAVWIMIGLDIIVSPEAAAQFPATFHVLLPVWFRLCVWWLPAVIAILVARDDSRSHWGLGALMVSPIERAVSFLISWASVPLHDWLQWWPDGDDRGWLRAAYYVLMIAFVYLLALIPADVRAPLTGRRR